MPTSKPILCGSIAGSIGGLGIRMHNAAYRVLGLPYVYVAFEPASAAGALAAMRELGIRGLGVTMPFKEQVIPYLDELDDMSREIGAVNTIVNDSGRLKGYNTDGYGAIATLKEATSLEGKRVAVLGAGGAAKTVVWALKRFTGDITVYNRSEERGREAAGRFGANFGGGLDKLTADLEYDILVNCTAVGFKSEETPVTAGQLRRGCVVLDAVFAPAITQLQREAVVAGCTALPGTRMILHQALKQFELYTGVPAPFEVFEQAIREATEPGPRA